MKKEYKENDWTGKYERSGFSDMGFIVQVNARVWRDPEELDFCVTIEDCRQNPDVAGETFEGPLCNFPFIAQQILPETDEGDWE